MPRSSDSTMGEYPVPYSVAKMRHKQETFVRYCAEHGLSDKLPRLEDLFVTELA